MTPAKIAPGAGKGFGFLFEMGCGKTLTAIATVGAGYQMGHLKRVLIVAPTSVVAVWPKEFSEYAAFPYTIRTLLGDKAKRLKELNDLERFHYRHLKVAVAKIAPYADKVITLSLEKAVNAGGTPYSKVVIKKTGILPPAPAAVVKELRHQIKAQYKDMAITMDDYTAAPERGTMTGVSTRVLEIYGGPFDDETAASLMHQQAGEDCGWAGPAFIERLVQTDERQIIDAYEEMLSYVRDISEGKNGSHIAGISVVALADALIDHWFFGTSKEAAWNRAKRMARNILVDQVEGNATDVNENAVQFINAHYVPVKFISSY